MEWSTVTEKAKRSIEKYICVNFGVEKFKKIKGKNMQMTNGEIKRNYASAKNPKKQIKILSDLNCCKESEIEAILNNKNDKNKNCNKDVMEMLFKELDRIDTEIKEKEKRYKEIMIAMNVVESICKLS